MELSDLLATVRQVLATLPAPAGPAIAARFHHGPKAPVTPRWPAVMARHFPAAIAASADAQGLTPALAAAAQQLRWVTYDAYPPDEIGAEFRTGHAFASLIGAEDAPFPAQDFDLGFLLIAPGVRYRDHRHPAPELYLPLTGPHRWRFDGRGAFAPLPALAPVWNPPGRIHATEVGAVPFLALFVWTEDTAAAAEVVARNG